MIAGYPETRQEWINLLSTDAAQLGDVVDYILANPLVPYDIRAVNLTRLATEVGTEISELEATETAIAGAIVANQNDRDAAAAN